MIRSGTLTSRRSWLGAATALLAWPANRPAWAEQVLLPRFDRVIPPERLDSEFLQVREQRLDPVPMGQHSGGRSQRLARRPMRQPPTAYVWTGQRLGVPVWVLYGVALQESQLLFGGEALPYPWTLDVAGRAERHGSYQAARDALVRYLDQGLTNVDCGPMQVNWGYHSDLLGTANRALDPYLNLAVGASILKQGFAGSWPQAVGLYHTGSFSNGERRERAVRYVAEVSRRLSRHGLTLAQAAALLPGALS
jgi:hypothetical protein